MSQIGAANSDPLLDEEKHGEKSARKTENGNFRTGDKGRIRRMNTQFEYRGSSGSSLSAALERPNRKIESPVTISHDGTLFFQIGLSFYFISINFLIDSNLCPSFPIAFIRYKYTPLANLSMFIFSLYLPAFMAP